MTEIGITAMEYHLPEEEKLVSELFQEEEVPLGSFSKIVDFKRDIGIETVRTTEEMPSALSLKAAKKLMENAKADPEDIDVVIGFTSLPEDFVAPTWSSAGYVQESLGIKSRFTTAINTGGCASYHLALKTTMALMKSSDKINKALLVAGDRAPNLNKIYYPITIACDGGGALLLEKDPPKGRILGIETFSLGRLQDVWYVPGLPAEKPAGEVYEKSLHMHCNIDMFNKGVITINLFMFNKVINSVLESTGLLFDDIDFFVYPSFSTWDQSNFMKAFNIPPEKIYLKNLKRLGHVQECDLVVNYVDAVADGMIKDGDKVMVVSNGAGFAWSAAVIEH
ncbi:MAG: hypothetical protein MJE63_12095 [Proteobacteria bacterium]|nr:hypothetical protein [Pseudomonadota bacterium]